MLPILFGENSSRAVDSEKTHGNVQSQLMAQVLQTLQHLTTTDDVLYGTSDQRQYGDLKQLARKVLSEQYDLNKNYLNTSSARFPSEECMKFAAFWGCESYIRSHLSTETPDEQLKNILFRVIEGIHSEVNEVEGFPISFLNIVEMLLYQRGALKIKLKNQGIMESAGWIQRCLELVEVFLSGEADHNARIGVPIRVLGPGEEFKEEILLFADMTTLARVQTFMQCTLDCLSPIKIILESNGAVERLRYRFCQFKGNYYRIKALQSKSLERLLYSRRYPGKSDGRSRLPLLRSCPPGPADRFRFKFDEGDEPLDILREIISANDTLDEDTMEEEWARGGDGWLEEED